VQGPPSAWANNPGNPASSRPKSRIYPSSQLCPWARRTSSWSGDWRPPPSSARSRPDPPEDPVSKHGQPRLGSRRPSTPPLRPPRNALNMPRCRGSATLPPSACVASCDASVVGRSAARGLLVVRAVASTAGSVGVNGVRYAGTARRCALWILGYAPALRGLPTVCTPGRVPDVDIEPQTLGSARAGDRCRLTAAADLHSRASGDGRLTWSSSVDRVGAVWAATSPE